jgi:sugar phosphate isomerase/epimerase
METHLCWALEQRYLAGQAGTPAYGALRRSILRGRDERASFHMRAALRSLAELAECAGRSGVRLGLENRRHPFEIPSPLELELLLQEHDRSTVGFWYDTGHAQVLANLGFHGPSDWLGPHAQRIVGVHFHDCVGLRDHLLPGAGEIDFDDLGQWLPPEAVRVCEFDWFFEDEEIAMGRRCLQRAGLLRSPFD